MARSGLNILKILEYFKRIIYMNIPDVIINPKTNRPIVIGSRVHRMLIANAIYKIQERESSIMYNINEPNKEINLMMKRYIIYQRMAVRLLKG